MELILNLGIIVLFLILGYLIKYKQKYHWIVGFNDYHKENQKLKSSYHMEKIGNVMGNSCFVYALSLSLLMILKVDLIWIHFISMGTMIVFILIFMRNIKKVEL